MHLRLALHALWAFALVFGPGVAAGVFWWRAQSQAWALADQGRLTGAVITEFRTGERPQGGRSSVRTQAICRASLAFDAIDADGSERPVTVFGDVPCGGVGTIGETTNLIYLPSDPRVFEVVRGQTAATAHNRAWLLGIVGSFYLVILIAMLGLRRRMRGRGRLGRPKTASAGRLR